MKEHLNNAISMYNASIIEQEHLKKTITELEEQNKSFMNVSLIIATKNENNRLQNEISLLNKRLKYYENTKQFIKQNERHHQSNNNDNIEDKIKQINNDNNYNNEEVLIPIMKKNEAEENKNVQSTPIDETSISEENDDEIRI